MTVWVTHALADRGTIWLFGGHDEENRQVTFGVDHRVARDLQAILDEDGEVLCHVEDWQVLSVRGGE